MGLGAFVCFAFWFEPITTLLKLFPKQTKVHIFNRNYDLTKEEQWLKSAPASFCCFMIIKTQH